jgi:hypothetical protein
MSVPGSGELNLFVTFVCFVAFVRTRFAQLIS